MYKVILCLLLLLLSMVAKSQVTMESLGGVTTDFEIEFFGEKLDVVNQGIIKKAQSFNIKHGTNTLESQRKLEIMARCQKGKECVDNKSRLYTNLRYYFRVSLLSQAGDTLFAFSELKNNMEYRVNDNQNYFYIGILLGSVPSVALGPTHRVVISEILNYNQIKRKEKENIKQ